MIDDKLSIAAVGAGIDGLAVAATPRQIQAISGANTRMPDAGSDPD